jgi:hypothetical protein
MAKRSRNINQTTINTRIKQGSGTGRGSDYQPWLVIQDVPSQGLATRIKGWKTERTHHFLSKLELNYFYVLEWSPIVTDIREQYPLLPLEETLAIAEECGFRHPTVPKTQEPVVMTTDFLITVPQSLEITEQARTVKNTKDLQVRRTLEKLEIERRYWQNRNIDWGIVTPAEIPHVLAQNVDWLHPFFRTEDISCLIELDISYITAALTLRVTQPHLSLAKIAADCDDKLGQRPGTSLSLVRHLIANRKWQVDMNKTIQPSEPLFLLADPLAASPQVIRSVG